MHWVGPRVETGGGAQASFPLNPTDEYLSVARTLGMHAITSQKSVFQIYLGAVHLSPVGFSEITLHICNEFCRLDPLIFWLILCFYLLQ